MTANGWHVRENHEIPEFCRQVKDTQRPNGVIVDGIFQRIVKPDVSRAVENNVDVFTQSHYVVSCELQTVHRNIAGD